MYGAEAVILNLSRALNAMGHRSIVAAFSDLGRSDAALHQAAIQNGIEAHLIPCSGQMDRTVGTKIRELVKALKIDVVHAHGYKTDIYCYFALRGAKVPLVSTCHTWYDNDWKLALYGKVDRFVLRSFDGVVAVSEDVRGQLLRAGVSPNKVRLIRNGIDLTPFAGAVPSLREQYSSAVDQGRMVVGLVGRLAREKGIDVFVQAAQLVLQQMPGTLFVIVGDGEQRAALESLISTLNLNEQVKLLGSRSDMPQIYASLDLMVSASRQEGLPIAILEGLASGRALIATPVGAVQTVVRDGATGVLVPVEDVTQLSGAIVRLLRDKELRNALGAAGRQLIADEFSAERMARDYLQVYEMAGAVGGRA
jgi:glycosyltransferase involved in cell wall biosynthesis